MNNKNPTLSAGYPLVIFDWDGTIADSIGQIVAALRGAIADLQMPHRQDEQLRDIIGLGLEAALQKLFPEIPLEETLNLVQRYRHHYFVNSDQPLPTFSGMVELLDALQAAGCQLAVATGKSRRGLDLALEKTGLGDYFVATRCADETHSKPHPAMVNEILEKLWCEPADAVVVGDTEYDLQMASNAGVASIGVTWGVHPLTHLQKFNPVGIADKVSDLQNLLISG